MRSSARRKPQAHSRPVRKHPIDDGCAVLRELKLPARRVRESALLLALKLKLSPHPPSPHPPSPHAPKPSSP